MSQRDRATQFAALHVKGSPVLLYNAWDAGSAKAVLEAGAKAVATSSWAVAEAQGYRDGEHIPLDLVERIVARIADTVEVPVTADFEGGYSEDSDALAENVSRLLDLRVVGINFEDRVVKGAGLYPVYRQVCRISAIREAADKKGVGLFINARTDLFLGPTGDPAKFVDEALKRAQAYADAGTSGFFVPGLRDEALIGRICDGVTLPVNVLVLDGVPSNKRLASLGVARVSYGTIPFVRAMSVLKEGALEALS